MSHEDPRVAKYDAAADGYSLRYADPRSTARRQVRLARSWGRRLPAGASVLEIGCADGFVTEHLARAGLRVTAIDLSPRMIEVAGQRLGRAGLHAELQVADIDTFEPPRHYDAVVAIMRTFFAYVSEPGSVLSRLAGSTSKVLVDFNPRSTSVDEALASLQRAGFESVAWRPFFVPQRVRMGTVGLGLLRTAEHVPLVRGALLRHRFVAVAKGERNRELPSSSSSGRVTG